MMRSSPDPGHVRDQSSASAASRPAVSCSTPYTVPSAQRPATKASPRSGPCYSVARIGLPPACRFHRIGGGRGLLSAHPPSHCVQCCCARPRRRMAPRWRPASPSAPSTPGEWTNWRGAAATQPVPRRRFLVHRCSTLYRTLLSSRSQDPACQPASVVGQEDSSLGLVLVGWSASAGPGNHVHFPPSAPTSRGTTQRATRAARGCQPRACRPQQARAAIRWSQAPRPSRPSQSQAQERTARNRPPTASSSTHCTT